MPGIDGIHHVTAVAGNPQANLDFYAGTLGMRLVKRSVNQDDPGTYHLFFADGEGHPGTDLTFFPWPGARRGRTGAGQTVEVAFAVPPDSIDHWRDRLDAAGVPIEGTGERFGEPALSFEDPHGLDLAIVGTDRADDKRFTAWDRSPVPADHQLRGFHAVRLLERALDPTADVLTEVLGMERVGTDDGWSRYRGSDPDAGFVDVRAAPDAPRAMGGVGTVHHVAWQAGDGDRQRELRELVADHGLRPTQVIDRFWFESVYFREPGGVLFELATMEPGFTADEPLESLGERLVLPPWLEDRREAIEAELPPLEMPYETTTAASDAPAGSS